MYQIKVKNVEGCTAVFKADYNWRMGELIGALIESFGTVDITVSEEKEEEKEKEEEDE